MKKFSAILLIAALALTTGCASMSESKNKPAEQWDSAYIHAVEEAARNEPRGVDVIWIRPPASKQQAEDSDSR